MDTQAGRDQVKASAAGVTFWNYKNGAREILKVALDEAKYSGERYWFVGCIAKHTQSRKYIIYGTQNFFEENPTTELVNYCE